MVFAASWPGRDAATIFGHLGGLSHTNQGYCPAVHELFAQPEGCFASCNWRSVLVLACRECRASYVVGEARSSNGSRVAGPGREKSYVSKSSQLHDCVGAILRGSRWLWRPRHSCRGIGATRYRAGGSGHDRYSTNDREYPRGGSHGDGRDTKPRKCFAADYPDHAGSHAPAN
jgi:hypothetical protein